MQGVSTEVVAALSGIASSVNSVRELVVDTASSLEEQSATTQDISTRMRAMAANALGINDNMMAITAAAQKVLGTVGNTRQAALGLKH